jgi:hypothetical protein
VVDYAQTARDVFVKSMGLLEIQEIDAKEHIAEAMESMVVCLLALSKDTDSIMFENGEIEIN